MLKFHRNKQYNKIALYACAVVALTITAIFIGYYLPSIFRGISRFINALRPLIYGLVFAYIFNPLLRLCENRILGRLRNRPSMTPMLHRLLALLLTYFFLALLLFFMGLMVVPQITANYKVIITKLSDLIITGLDWFNSYFGNSSQSYSETVSQIAQQIIEFLSSIGGSLVLAAFRLIVGLFLSFFVLMHKERMIGATKKLLAAILPRRVFNGVISVTRLTDNTFGKFFIGNLFDSLIIGILSFIVFWITGMPYYPLLSVIVGVTNVVPYFGPIIGAIPCIMLGLTDSLPRAFWLGVIILIIQQIDGNIISPKILGDATGLSSLWVVVAITVMGSFFGFVGMVIGVPLFSVVYTLIKNVTERRLKKKNMPTETAAYRHGSSPIPLVSPYEAFSDAYIQAEEDFESIRRQEEAPEDSTDGQASDQDGSADSNADTKETADTEEDMASAGADDEEKACPEQNQTDENSPEEQDSEMPGQIDIFALPEEENERDTSQSSAPDAPPDTPVSGTEEAPLSGEKSTPVSVEEAPPASTGADPDRSDDAPAAEGYDEDDSMPTGTAQTVLVSLTDDRKPQTLPSGKKKGRSHFRNNRKKSNDRGGKGGKRS